ncbi:MAG: aldo/keto reductase [Chloroflexi bacterium]|nr:aldo/keto reductase [Chloroflexota bacterium]
MQYRELGNTGLKISTVGFGLWTVTTTWWGITDDAVGIGLLRRAHELGVNFFDTADTYGGGKGETLLAEALGQKRDEIIIATKFGYDWYNNPSRRGQQERPHDWSPDFVRFACEESLKRLDTDYIDFYQMHNPRMTAIESDELIATLEDLKSAGKIRHYGATLGPAIGWEAEGLAVIRDRNIAGLQQIYNLLEQEPGRRLTEACEAKGVGVISRVTHSSGLLEGKYTLDTKFDKTDHRSHRKREWLVEGLQKVDQLAFLTEGTGRTIGQAALQWLLASPAIASTLPNIYNEEQLVEFAEAADVPPLTEDELARVQQLYDGNFGLTRQEASVGE